MPSSLSARYSALRQHSLQIAAPLSDEDQCVQSMPDASPTKWHLAHTSWFFENVVLLPFVPGYQVFDEAFAFLFNSYYEALGPRHPRPQRGLLTRPSLTQVLAFRQHVDAAMQQVLREAENLSPQALALIELGLNHEQQHQELMQTDILHLLSCNPLLPVYEPAFSHPRANAAEVQWLSFEEGLHSLGRANDAPGFAFDNETPKHQRFVQGFQIAHRLVTCGEYLAFIEDGGYDNADLWLSEGRAQVLENAWQCPPYWLAPQDPRAPSDHWQVFGLNGVQTLDPQAPVSSLSFYEASAFAQWAGARLPTEFEWELASAHPQMHDLHGQVWQWTRSAYEPYPGFVPASGAVREYNGKFMVGQQVLRGSSFATPAGHSRHTYRNFFPASARWQFSGLRLAKDLQSPAS
jgi:ergothioneine biosynthesis protein EgtB